MRCISPTHWINIVYSLALNVCIFIVLGWFIGTIYLILITYLGYRQIKEEEKGGE